MKLHIALVTLVLSSVSGVESRVSTYLVHNCKVVCDYEYELTQLISFISASTLSLQKFRLFNANIEEDYNNNNLRGRRQLPKKLGHDDLFDPPGKGKDKANPPAWGPGGNPDGTSEDHTLEPTSVDSLSDDRRKLSGSEPSISESEASESEDSQASEESEASAGSLDDERRKLPGNGWGRGGNPDGSPDDVTVTSATSVASDDSGTSATSAASAESETSAE